MRFKNNDDPNLFEQLENYLQKALFKTNYSYGIFCKYNFDRNYTKTLLTNS